RERRSSTTRATPELDHVRVPNQDCRPMSAGDHHVVQEPPPPWTIGLGGWSRGRPSLPLQGGAQAVVLLEEARLKAFHSRREDGRRFVGPQGGEIQRRGGAAVGLPLVVKFTTTPPQLQ
ncbi:hypothetical protein Dimus_017347, partial [Dionaea muscipula]